MADETITVEVPTVEGATYTVDPIQPIVDKHRELQKQIATTKREISQVRAIIENYASDTPQYQKATVQLKNAMRDLTDLQKQDKPYAEKVAAWENKRKADVAAQKAKAAGQQGAQERSRELSDAQSALKDAENKLKGQQRRAKDLGLTGQEATDYVSDERAAYDAAKERLQTAKTAASTAVGVVSTTVPERRDYVPAAQPSISPSGYDYTHGKQVTSGQILWKEGNDWVVKNQADFIGPGGQVKTEYISQIRQALRDAGYRDAKSLVDLTNNWRDLVSSTGGQYSPLEASKWSAEFLGGAGGAGGAGGGGGGGFTTQYYKTIQTPQGLRSDIDKIYQATLGRDATWKEVVEATDFVNNQIDKDPYKVTQTAAGRTESGLTKDAAMSMLVQGLKKNPEYAEQVGQNFETWVEQKTGLKFADIVNDPSLDAALRLYKAGNEVDALRALKNTATIKGAEGSKLAGEVATARDTLAKYADAMGVAFDVQSAADAIAKGLATDADYKNQIKELAKSYYPSWAKQIDAGQTMASIAYPYMNSMSNILELNPADVNVNDPMIKKALTYRDKDGNATSQSIWDFEQSLRQDPRWGYTKNARTELDSVARSVLRDFGLAY